MKKLIALLIVLSLVLTVFPVIAFAEDQPFDAEFTAGSGEPPSLTDTYLNALEQNSGEQDDEPAQEPTRDRIPDDAFEGDYKDFRAKDGTVTRVYDNGSIVTTYPDGSREGMDYYCNRYTEDKDGRQVLYDTDGNQHIKNADGSEEAISKGGTHMFYNEYCAYRAVAATGTVFEYDENENLVAVSIEGGERLTLVDENGDFISDAKINRIEINGNEVKFAAENDKVGIYVDSDWLNETTLPDGSVAIK